MDERSKQWMEGASDGSETMEGAMDVISDGSGSKLWIREQ